MVGSPSLGLGFNQSTALSRQGSIVTISRNGIVTSHTTLGHSAVLINAVEDNGVEQTIAVHVEVRIIFILPLGTQERHTHHSITLIYRKRKSVSTDRFIVKIHSFS